MKRDWFWRVIAVSALTLAAVYVGMSLRGDTPVTGRVWAGGGAASNVIAFSQDGGSNTLRLYIVDTQQRVLLVYQSTAGDSNFRFVYGRLFANDAELATFGEIPFKQQGYGLQEIANMLRDAKRRSGTRNR